MTKFRTVFRHQRKYVIPIQGKDGKITRKDRKEWHKNAELVKESGKRCHDHR
ncbi:MAG: hypothetical protein M0Z77_08815 [Thermoplasmatales archaeon]|nr:hypothetical protein [Thermoplasmatales archaeon]